jgi:hypothetical protein
VTHSTKMLNSNLKKRGWSYTHQGLLIFAVSLLATQWTMGYSLILGVGYLVSGIFADLVASQQASRSTKVPPSRSYHHKAVTDERRRNAYQKHLKKNRRLRSASEAVSEEDQCNPSVPLQVVSAFAVFGLTPTDSENKLIIAYRKLARTCHPEKDGSMQLLEHLKSSYFIANAFLRRNN